MKQVKVNKTLFWFGLALILISSASLLFVEKDLGAWPMINGFFGLIAIGASRYRPMK
jgi:hypothetical protein